MRFWDSGCWVCIGNDNDATDLLYKNFNGKKTASGGKLIIMGVYPEFGNYFQETKQNMSEEIQAQIKAGSGILCGGSPQGSCGKGLASSTIQLFDKDNRITKSFNVSDFNSSWILIDPTGKVIITPETNQGWPSPIYMYLNKNETWK